MQASLPVKYMARRAGLDSHNLAVAPRKCGAYFLLPGLAISALPGAGFAAELLSGILSRPWSPLASLPPSGWKVALLPLHRIWRRDRRDFKAFGNVDFQGHWHPNLLPDNVNAF